MEGGRSAGGRERGRREGGVLEGGRRKERVLGEGRWREGGERKEGGRREECWGECWGREGGGREECWGEGGSSQSSHHLPTHRKNLPYKERVNSVYMPAVQLYLQTIILQVWQECTALSHYGRGCPPTNIPHSKHSPLAVFVKSHTKKHTELHPLRKAHNSQRHTHTHDSVNAHSVY